MTITFTRFKAACLLFIVSMCFSSALSAQDIQLSQFYAASNYLNPAFTRIKSQYNVSFHQRIQWPKLDAKYTTSMFNAETRLKRYNSSVGLMVIQDMQGDNTFSSTEVNLMYSYELKITRNLWYRQGLQLGYTSRFINYANLTLPSQFTDKGFQGGPGLTSEYGDRRVHYADMSAGGLLYSNNFWISVSTHHLNTPNQLVHGKESKLPMKGAIAGGYKIHLKKSAYSSVLNDEKEISITPTAHYKFQGKSDQLDLGFYQTYDFLVAGFWHRGIPTKRFDKSLHNHESIVVLGGVRYQSLSFGYSYDINLSGLVNTGGAHEVSLSYSYDPRKTKKYKKIPCPTL